MPAPRRRPDDLGIALLRRGDPLASLRALAATRAEVEDAIADQIARAMRDGASWTDVGDALGVSRQAARQRYRELVADAAGKVRGAERDAPVTWPTAGFSVVPGVVVGVDAPVPRDGAEYGHLLDLLLTNVDERFNLSPEGGRGRAEARRAHREGDPRADRLDAQGARRGLRRRQRAQPRGTGGGAAQHWPWTAGPARTDPSLPREASFHAIEPDAWSLLTKFSIVPPCMAGEV